jgi:PAS domain S-box-containing protein
MPTDKTVWELLWDYDPNGLFVLDSSYRITLVNTAFCEMFHADRDQIIGQHLSAVLEDADDMADFREVWETNSIIRGKEKHYPRHNLYAKKVMFAIPEHGLMACIFVDLSHEHEQKEELRQLREETLRNVSLVVDKHMKTAQEIASLLGETTAETKVSLLRLAEMLKKGAI